MCETCDVHNQAQEFELAMEKRWVSHEVYFRVCTTYIRFLVAKLLESMKNMNQTFFKQWSIIDESKAL